MAGSPRRIPIRRLTRATQIITVRIPMVCRMVRPTTPRLMVRHKVTATLRRTTLRPIPHGQIVGGRIARSPTAARNQGRLTIRKPIGCKLLYSRSGPRQCRVTCGQAWSYPTEPWSRPLDLCSRAIGNVRRPRASFFATSAILRGEKNSVGKTRVKPSFSPATG